MKEFINLQLRQVTESNWKDVVHLTVGKEQLRFIESNAISLVESKFVSVWRPISIYENIKLIGFAMYGEFLNEGDGGRVWLDRFMIDEKYQGMGYGKSSFNLLIQHITKEYNCKEIYLSIYEENSLAKNMYENYGFEFNGELDENEEKIMVLKVES